MGKKSSSPPAPDPNIGIAAQVNAETGKEMVALGREQAEWNKKEYEDVVRPVIKEASDLELQTMRDNAARATAQWESYQSQFMPAEERLARFAMDYDTPERREADAARAAADVSSAYDTASEVTNRELERYGINPGDKRFLAVTSDVGLRRAKDTAGAMNAARRNTELTGAALIEGAAKFGRNLPSTGIAADTVAIQGGNAAASNAAGGLAARNTAVNSALPWYGGGTQATTASGNLLLGQHQAQLRAWEQQQQSDSDFFGGVGRLAGVVGSAWMGTPAGKRFFAAKGGIIKKRGFMRKGYADGGLVRVGDGQPKMIVLCDSNEDLDPTGHFSGYKRGGLVRRDVYQDGGMVMGPGTETSDSVPAMVDGTQPARLSTGEGVLNAGAVDIVGEDFVHRINQAGLQRRVPQTIEGEAIEEGQT